MVHGILIRMLYFLPNGNKNLGSLISKVIVIVSLEKARSFLEKSNRIPSFRGSAKGSMGKSKNGHINETNW